MDSFSDWLDSQERADEVATDTGQVAHFARPAVPGVGRRMYPPLVTMGDDERKRRKKDRGEDL